MIPQRLFGALMAAVVIFAGVSSFATADAKHYRGYNRYDQGRHYDNRRGGIDYKTGKIIKGGVVGAGIGAGAGLLLDRPVGRTALVGAGIGAGTQAVRYSRTMHRHPVVKTAAYGALAGTGVQAARGRRLAPGALWGGGIGAGIGALRNF